MDGLLTQVSTSYNALGQDQENDLVEIRKPPEAVSNRVAVATSPADALEILRNEPSYEALISTLHYLTNETSGVDITSPSAHASQLVHVLVSDIVPNYWNILQESDSVRKKGALKRSSNLNLFLSCLRSVTGLNAIILGLKQAIQQSREPKKAIGGGKIQDVLARLLQVVSRLLEGDQTIKIISENIWHPSNVSLKQKAIWNEFLSVVAGGRLLGICAEADDTINGLSKGIHEKHWVSDGVLYSRWLAQNITHWAKIIPLESENGWKSCGELLSKALRLGYTDNIIKEIISTLILSRPNHSASFEKLLGSLANFEQRNLIQGTLQLVSREYLSHTITSEDNSTWWKSDAEFVSAAAGLINLVLNTQESRKAPLISWLTSSSGAGVGEGIAIRRAAIAALSGSRNDLEAIFEKSLQQFGDQLYIRHTPITQQEAHTQVLLLSAGFVKRTAPLRLSMMMRSGVHLGAISNRLATSSPRARFLGMVVGEALSSLVDKGDKIMDFKMDEMKSPEAIWYKGLVTVSDTLGPLDPLTSKLQVTVTKKAQPRPVQRPNISKGAQGGSKIVAIEEVEDSDSDHESDNNDLVPYAKPDSDEEDSDEDATLVSRNKPTAPVYIRDLINYLRDTESYDKQKLALQSAASLIRRKASFGTEVTSHSEELAALLVGLQDKYEIDDFQDMRLQGMIAMLIAQPVEMGKWFSKTFFDGDYSISQRATILTTIGLGARELGGLNNESSDLAAKKSISSFPSKALPEAMHQRYGVKTLELGAVDKLSTELSNTMIAPMAAELADKLTGPSILKVRTFSSRMEVEKKRKKPIANSLAKVVAESLFFPLTGRFAVHLKAFGSSRSNVVFQPFLLTLYVKTLALLLHSSGPSTLALPQMTSEFWDLLLGLRTQSIGDISVIEAMLFAFLTILDMNEDKRRLVTENGRQMLETQEWVETLFGRLGASASEEDERVRMLAAGCLVRIREAVEKYQALLMGDLASFQT